MAEQKGPGLRISVSLSPELSFLNPEFCKAYAAEPDVMPFGDLVLLKLAENLPEQLAASILPIEGLATPVDSDEFVYAAGYGEANASWIPGIKNYARLRFKPRLCQQVEEQTVGCRAGSETITVDPEHKADTCYADSGAPLFIRKDENSVWKLVGIVSRGLKQRKDKMCGDGGINTSLEAEGTASWLRARITE